MLRIFTDFDGPIMDVSERYYRVYQSCLAATQRPSQAVTVLTKEEFWRLKRSRVLERQIGQLSGLDREQSRAFAHLRHDTVHAVPNLIHDRLVPGAVEALERFQAAGIEPIIVTMRKTRELNYALDQYDLHRFFPAAHCYCLADNYVKTTDIEEKPLLMQRAIAALSPAKASWMIGDTEADIVAAQKNQVAIIAILSGIRDREQLSAYAPDYILADLIAATDWILQAACVNSFCGDRL